MSSVSEMAQFHGSQQVQPEGQPNQIMVHWKHPTQSSNIDILLQQSTQVHGNVLLMGITFK